MITGSLMWSKLVSAEPLFSQESAGPRQSWPVVFHHRDAGIHRSKGRGVDDEGSWSGGRGQIEHIQSHPEEGSRLFLVDQIQEIAGVSRLFIKINIFVSRRLAEPSHYSHRDRANRVHPNRTNVNRPVTGRSAVEDPGDASVPLLLY
jgi:hypothetical protein